MKKSSKKITSSTHDGLIDQIIEKIKSIDRLATDNPVVLKKAKELRGKSESETIKNCFQYVHRTVAYCDDPAGTEHITSPWLLISGQKTCEDCESMVLLLSSLLRANGIKTQYMVLSWKDPKDLRFSHIVLQAKDGGSWITLDPTMKEAGYGHTVTPNRKKIYGSPMPKLDLITLSDKPNCRCGGSCNNCRRRPSGTPAININIGNTSSHSANNNNKTDITQRLLSQLTGKAPKEETMLEIDKIIDNKLPVSAKKQGHEQLFSTIKTSNKTYNYFERY
jgi:hypothetical protein